MTSSIRRILNDPTTAVIFDIDGTLTDIAVSPAWWDAWYDDDSNWESADPYASCRRIETMADYIERHGTNRVACLAVETDGRQRARAEVVGRNYGIPGERVFFVDDEERQVEAARSIVEKLFPDAGSVVIVDDEPDILRMFDDETDYVTASPMAFVM